MMDNKHYAMLGDAVRLERSSQLDSTELGKLIMRYVDLLQAEAMRDMREQKNKEQA
jgi:hypothetical protein